MNFDSPFVPLCFELLSIFFYVPIISLSIIFVCLGMRDDAAVNISSSTMQGMLLSWRV